MSLNPQYYSVSVPLPQKIEGLSREEWVQKACHGRRGFLGVVEGSVVVKERILDSADAPRSRDLVDQVTLTQAEFYFDSIEAARDFEIWASKILENHSVPFFVREEQTKDWNQEWKKMFRGVQVGPWKIQPPWEVEPKSLTTEVIILNPSFGFGSGTHATTQICLQQIALLDLTGKEALDFGAGSGILSVAVARRGARVKAIEIDPLALESCRETLSANEVEQSAEASQYLNELPDGQRFDFIVANILSGVLTQFARDLVHRLNPRGQILMSGLLEEDVELIRSTYTPLLASEYQVRILQQGEWWGIHFFC